MRIGPFKTEILHHRPMFIMFHELFTDGDIDFFVNWAKPRLTQKREILLSEDKWGNRNVHKTLKVYFIVYPQINGSF